MDRPGTKAVFARNLRAAVPGMVAVRPRDGDVRSHTWRGIRLHNLQLTGPLTTPDQDLSGAAGQGSDDRQIWLSHAGGQGWSGVEPTVGPSPLVGRSVRCSKHEKVTTVQTVAAGIAYFACGCFVEAA